MKSYRRKISLVILMTFFLSSLAFAVEQRIPTQKHRVVSKICYGKLYNIRQKPNNMAIFVNNRQFTITESTPVLFERAQKLLNKKVQVIYNKKNGVVINLFGDYRDEPR